jgi:hypothetical protein
MDKVQGLPFMNNLLEGEPEIESDYFGREVWDIKPDIKLSEFITEHKCSVMGAIEKLVGKQNFQLVMT